MFEDFSFSSPSSNRPPRLAIDDDRLMVDCDSAMISPLSSRCPSPNSSLRKHRNLPGRRSLYVRTPPAPTSVPPSYDQKRLSISTLTEKLHEHTLQNPASRGRHDELPISPQSPDEPNPSRNAGSFLTPPDTDHEEAGYFDSSSLTPASLSPHSQSPFLSPTSMPADLMSMDQDIDPQNPANVRAQRQHIVSRVQCNPAGIEAIRRTLLMEGDNSDTDSGENDCHPSSLPPQVSPRRRAVTFHRSRFSPSGTENSISDPRGRRKSSSGCLPSHRSDGHRIDKAHHHQSPRDLRKKSEQGLRRKSLVSAALASMAEKASHSDA